MKKGEYKTCLLSVFKTEGKVEMEMNEFFMEIIEKYVLILKNA